MYRFSNRSLKNLQGIDAKLIILAGLMLNLSPYDFIITCGLRTKEEQRRMVDAGKSQTMNSKHIIGEAFDIVILVDGKITWEKKYYKEFTDVLKKLAKELRIEIICGYDFRNHWDCPHIQLK